LLFEAPGAGWLPLGVDLPELLVGVLAVWRVTHLIQAEDGPWDLSVRLRRAAGQGFWGRLLDCFYCLSLWVSAVVALLLAGGAAQAILLWVALSGGAIVLNRLLPVEARWKEDP
jgi:hypothetical protein